MSNKEPRPHVSTLLVEAVEFLGQQHLVTSELLPSAGLLGENRPMWEACGIQIVPSSEDPPLFVSARLPAGWRKISTDHQYWSHLLDEAGRVRGRIFFKAVIYDRRADIQPATRFVVKRDFDRQDSMIAFHVTDCGAVVFTTDARPSPTGTGPEYGEALREVEDALTAACEKWLGDRGFSNYRDPSAYWTSSEAPR